MFPEDATTARNVEDEVLPGSAVVVMSQTPIIGDSPVVTGRRRDICKPSK